MRIQSIICKQWSSTPPPFTHTHLKRNNKTKQMNNKYTMCKDITVSTWHTFCDIHRHAVCSTYIKNIFWWHLIRHLQNQTAAPSFNFYLKTTEEQKTPREVDDKILVIGTESTFLFSKIQEQSQRYWANTRAFFSCQELGYLAQSI